MIPLRLYVYAAAAIGVIGLLWFAHHRSFQSGYEAATAEMAKQVAQANEAARLAEINSRESVEAVDRDFQVQLQELDAKYRNDANKLGPVRVSKCPTGGIALSADPKPAALDHGPAKDDGLSRDVSPDLERLLRDADEQTKRLIACQAYAATVTAY